MSNEKNNFIEFNPRPLEGQATKGFALAYKLFTEKDRSWLSQSASSITRWACSGGNGLFAEIATQAPEEVRNSISAQVEALKRICIVIAEFVKKDYDLSFSQVVEKERTVTIDVPKIRKVGLFKKERYIDHETKTERFTGKEDVTYKGWRIERLSCKETYYNRDHTYVGGETLFLDYCLGADGKLYLIASSQESSDDNSMLEVVECISYSPIFLNEQVNYLNIYSAAISGVLGALDGIPIDKNDPLRDVHIKLDDDEDDYYNFPIEMKNESFPYAFLDGTINRMINLLDAEGKEECLKKYEWMEFLLGPE